MTTDSVSANLHALLLPLESLLKRLEQTLQLASRTNLPQSFVDTIKRSLTRLNGAYDEMLDISTTLDPTLCEREP